MEGYYVVRTIKAGSVGEKIKFFVPSRTGKRNKRRERTSEEKQAQNEYSQKKRLTREINANFHTGDILLGLDYSPEALARIEGRAEKLKGKATTCARGDVREDMYDEDFMILAANVEMENLMKRVRRAGEKLGLSELKYIYITSDMDGDTGETVRVHHHLLIPAEWGEVFHKCWEKNGSCDWEYLSRQDDYMPIAEYLLRQIRRVPDGKAYHPSRNLRQPEVKDRIVYTDSMLNLPKGAKLLGYSAPNKLAHYMRYVLPEYTMKC